MNLAALARDLGLGRVDPRRIGHASNLVVHLHPAPVVARVMTATRVLHDDEPAWLERVVSVASFLAERDAPVAPPTDLVAPGPHAHEGEWVTLWRWIDADPGPPPTPAEAARSLRVLHAGLAEYPGELPSFAETARELDVLLERRPPGPEDEPLREELARLRPGIRTAGTVQPLHGDVSLSNVLREHGRLLWNDLEDVCIGPVSWDLTGLTWKGPAREVLAAYGDRVDPTEIARFEELFALYGRVWRTYRSGLTRDTLQP